jgi:hypothetical protein
MKNHNAPTIETTLRFRVPGLVVLLLMLAAPTQASTIFSYPFGGTGADTLDRGFYLSDYDATNIDEVTLMYYGRTSGDYTTSLTLRLGTYDGPILGTSTMTRSYEAGVRTLVTYAFGGAPVPFGSLITFTQELLAGPSEFLFYDIGAATGPSGITQTESTDAPLDEFRRDQVGVTITAVPEPASVVMLGSGLIGALAVSRRRREKRV